MISLSGAVKSRSTSGAWYCSQHHFREVMPHFGAACVVQVAPASASPAVGYMSVHQETATRSG